MTVTLDFSNIDHVLRDVEIRKHNIEEEVSRILQRSPIVDDKNVAAWVLQAISVLDLTTLAGDDTSANVTRLCVKAANPLPAELAAKLGFRDGERLTTAAVCVYPARVADARAALDRMGMLGKIKIAAVATGFPSGQYPLSTRLEEIRWTVSQGADEIDVVIDRSLVLTGRWQELYEEVKLMGEACGDAHMKVILGVGELGTLENVYKASMVAMLAGAHFIKTSTGKEAVNATLPVGLVMCRAIRDYRALTGREVGLKPAGGISSVRDALRWLALGAALGPAWTARGLLRLGASGVLAALEARVAESVARGE